MLRGRHKVACGASLLLLLCQGPAPLRGEVFSLRPGTGHPATPADLLGAREVLREAVRANGQPATLVVAVSDLTLADAAVALRPWLGEGEIASAGGMLMLRPPNGGGSTVRHALLSSGPERQTLLFSWHGAAPPARAMPPSWPRTLPEPPAARIETVLELTARRTLYALFSTGGDPRSFLGQYDLRLQDAGWQRVEGSGRGGLLYRHPARGGLLLVAAAPSLEGTAGALFLTSDRDLPPQD